MNWNEAPPFQAEGWGIKIWTLSKDNAEYVQLFQADSYESKNLLVKISKVGDDELISKNFQLDNF